MPETTAKKAAAPRSATPDHRGEHAAVWEELAKPFPQDEVERLPRNLQARDQDKGRCEAGSRYCADDHPCGGWHARSVHLDYVGHAGITMRLNDVVGPANWNLEPMAVSPDGLPLFSRGEFWARLTILGVTKLEVAANFNGPQEALGDVLRRAASRFGVGTYLWSKSEKALELKRATDDVEPTPPPQQQNAGPPPHVAILRDRLTSLPEHLQTAIRSWWPATIPELMQVNPDQARVVLTEVERLEAQDPWKNAEPWAQDGPQDPPPAP